MTEIFSYDELKRFIIVPVLRYRLLLTIFWVHMILSIGGVLFYFLPFVGFAVIGTVSSTIALTLMKDLNIKTLADFRFFLFRLSSKVINYLRFAVPIITGKIDFVVLDYSPSSISDVSYQEMCNDSGLAKAITLRAFDPDYKGKSSEIFEFKSKQNPVIFNYNLDDRAREYVIKGRLRLMHKVVIVSNDAETLLYCKLKY